MLTQSMGFQKNLPTQKPNSDFVQAASDRVTRGEEAPDFDKLMGQSNAEKAVELAKEQDAVGPDGELRIGETKNDQEFRQMLEKVTGKKQDAKKNKLDKEDYLNLMVTQLKHQDPMKPMDNQEMATQLAQFNTVEQLIGVNKTLESMQAQSSEARIDKLAPYLGKSVEVNGDKLKVTTKDVSQAQFDLPGGTGTTSVQIKDAAGKVVRTLNMGPLQSGQHKIQWDGKDETGFKTPEGQYTFSITATAPDGKPIKAKPSFTAKVDSITDLSSGGKLGTTSGPIDVKDVIAIRTEDVQMTAAAPSASTAPLAAGTSPSQTAQTQDSKIAGAPAQQAQQQQPAAAAQPSLEQQAKAADAEFRKSAQAAKELKKQARVEKESQSAATAPQQATQQTESPKTTQASSSSSVAENKPASAKSNDSAVGKNS